MAPHFLSTFSLEHHQQIFHLGFQLIRFELIRRYLTV